MATVGSDTTKYFLRHIGHTTEKINDLVAAQERFRAVRESEGLRAEALRTVTAVRFGLIRKQLAPHSTTIRLGEIASALQRETSVKGMCDLMVEFRRITGPYRTTK